MTRRIAAGECAGPDEAQHELPGQQQQGVEVGVLGLEQVAFGVEVLLECLLDRQNRLGP